MSINNEVPNIIRIGIIYDNQIIRERLVLPNESVTIGRSGSAMFTIDVSFDEFELLESKGDGVYTLKFIDKMEGYIRNPNRQIDYELSQMKAERIASFRKDVYTYDVSETYLGKIVVEEKYTILFQFIKSPPLALKEEFSFEPEYVGDDDIIFLGFWGLFSSFALVMLFWIEGREPPKQSTEEIQERIAEMLNVEPPKEEEVEVEEVEEEQDEPEEQQENQEVNPNAQAEVPQEAPQEEVPEEAADVPEETVQEIAEDVQKEVAASNASAQDIAEAQAEVESSALMMMLGSRGGDGSAGFVSSAFDGSGADVNLDESLKNVTSGKVASSADKLAFEGATDKSGRATSSSGVQKGSNVKDVKASKGAAVTGPKKGKMKTKTNLATASEECSVSIKDVVRKNKKQVKFCYDNELKSNPSLQGKLVLEFAIKGGAVKNFTIAKNETGSKTLAICVEKKVTKWKFPGNCSEDLARLPFTLFPE